MSDPIPTPFQGAARATAYLEPGAPPPVERIATAELEAIMTPPAPHEPEAPASLPAAPGGADLGRLALREEPARATTGVRGLAGRLGIRLAPSAVERARLSAAEVLAGDEATIRQATWTRAVGILVANRKGGVGKTPAAIALGGLLAQIRGGSTAIIEVADDPGTLAFRTEGRPRLGIGELADDVETIRSLGQLSGYTAPQTSYAAVIGSPAPRRQLVAEDVTRISRLLDTYYAIRVMDSGNQPSSSAFTGAVAAADALVIPVLNSADVVLEAIALLDQLRAAGPHGRALADGAVILRLTDGRPESPRLLEELDRLVDAQHVAAVRTIPYDAHIADRGPISLGRIDPATRAAFTAAAADVVRTLQTRPLEHLNEGALQ